MLDTYSATSGWIAALCAVISFGSFGVPMKCEASNTCDVDPLVFQTYKTVMCFLSSFFVLLFGIKLSFSPWGIVSGFFWVPAGTAGIYAVRKAGLAISVGIWSSVIVIMSFFWGIFIFHEGVRSKSGACAAAAVLIVGIWGLSIYSHSTNDATKPRFVPDYGDLTENTNSSSGSGSDKEDLIYTQNELGNNYGSTAKNFDESVPCKSHFQIGTVGVSTYQMGLMGAVFNGLWAGTMMVPLHFSSESTKGLQFAISFGTGSLIITALIWIGRLIFHYFREGSFQAAFCALPSFHFSLMWKPGCTAGLLWSIGNMCSILSVTALGQGIGYSVVQSAMLVSGLWGIFYYKEVQGENNIRLWFVSAAITIFGILWLSYEHVQR